ncbi:MAG TPA: PEP/pyruvate-binding domain-containing protein [Spirochaetales bacterium]|nr:PEP/pyruvate-binding domain-containing protein [Spirochaetales bacterium]
MYVKTFKEISKDMTQDCGGKASHLGELTHLGLNVPPGYTVLWNAYYRHIEANGLTEKIRSIVSTINFDNYEDAETKTQKIRDLIIAAPMPSEIEEEIVKYYGMLPGEKDPFVAVRSSVAIRDSTISSFPGLMDTYHYIKGAPQVVEKVKECWASVWSTRAAVTRNNKKLDHEKAVIAPTIQLMVNSEVAGVAFTMNPVTKAKDEIMIESNWGLGETVVSGKATSDLFIIDKKTGEIKSQTISNKEDSYVQAEGGGGKWIKVDPVKAKTPSMTPEMIKELCRVAHIIEDHYGYPQDIEWAFEKGKLYILQARKARASGE